MPRVIITNDNSEIDGAQVVLDERVDSNALNDERAAGAFVERIGWAINDAEASAAAAAWRSRRDASLEAAASRAALSPRRHSRVALLLAREAA